MIEGLEGSITIGGRRSGRVPFTGEREEVWTRRDDGEKMEMILFLRP